MWGERQYFSLRPRNNMLPKGKSRIHNEIDEQELKLYFVIEA